DPARYVIHRSEEHLFIYGTSTFERDGMRDVMGAQISPPHCRMVITCAPPDPVDPLLAISLGERHRVDGRSMNPGYAEVRHVAPQVQAYGQPAMQPSPPGYFHESAPGRAAQSIQMHQRQAPEPPSSPPDPRHPGHPHHAMYRSVRGQLHALYAEQSISLSEPRLENMTAAIMADARRSNMTRVTSLEFSYDDNDRPDVNRYIFAYNGDPERDYTPESSTDVKTASVTPPEQSYQQFQQSDEHFQERALQRQHELAREHSHGMGRSL
ncbi:XVIPCD domain-containing protein, partial [Luteibacter sp. Sphag1AF]|uniref:XVIPCD domain-containing protein n=1 Tax=Luteibacter sp. Sphag1AF TaxID=2587031 RepID=UPI001C8438FC